MGVTWKILKRDLSSSFMPAGKGWAPLKMIAGWIAWFLFVGLAYYGSTRLFMTINSYFQELPGLIDSLSLNILNMAALFPFIMTLIQGFQISYKTMYESGDIGFLMAQPVPVASVFSAKFGMAYINACAISFPFSVSVWLGYGVVNKVPGIFYLLTLAGFFLIMLMVHSLVSILILIAMRYLPGRKMKQLFIAFSAIFGLLIVFVSQYFSSRIARTNDPSQLFMQIAGARLGESWYLPSTWYVNSVLSSVPRFEISWFPWTAALVGSTFLVAYVAVKFSNSMYLGGWSMRNEELRSAKAGKVKKVSGVSWISRRFRGSYWSVLKKDLTLLVRDPIIWYTMAVSVIALGFFLFNIRVTGELSGPDSFTMGYLLAMMSGLMGGVAGSQTGGISVSREGEGFWLLRSSPADVGKVFWAKATYALFSPLILTLVFLPLAKYVAHMEFPFVATMVIGLCISAIVAAFQILLDLLNPDFGIKIEFGQSFGKGSGKLLISMFGTMGMVIFVFIVLVSFPVLSNMVIFQGLNADTLILLTRLFVVLIAFIFSVIAVVVGKKKMEQLFTDL